MLKRTLYFGNSCCLKKKDMQMTIEYPEKEIKPPASVPIEDIGLVMLDHPQITISHALIMALSEHNAAIISCDEKHLPYGLMLPMFSHHAFTEKMYQQLSTSLPLKKNLWQQTIIAKISNQAALLRKVGVNDAKMQYLAKLVKSGDPQNVEGRAAAYYWDNLFGANGGFLRDRNEGGINAMLNYGYAILLAIVARGLVSSGLLPAVGIHHRNKYNPWCLASDIMEPYRPYVDRIVMKVSSDFPEADILKPEIKRALLQIPAIDIEVEGKKSPLMVGMQRTTASLSACFEGTARKILYPNF